MKINNTLKLIIAVVISELAGVIGSIFTTSSIVSWYANIAKPEIAPPNWIFGPVWITLFALMGMAWWLVWINTKADRKTKQHATVFFFAQLGLNILWSSIFFGQHFIGGAFLEILALWVMILITIFYFSKVSKFAAWFLIPYIFWVSFAAYLNYLIWILN